MWRPRRQVGKALTPHLPTARQREKQEYQQPRWPTRTSGCVAKRPDNPTTHFLEVKMTFATPGGRKELKIKETVADSGAQITIFPASLLKASGVQISGCVSPRWT